MLLIMMICFTITVSNLGRYALPIEGKGKDVQSCFRWPAHIQCANPKVQLLCYFNSGTLWAHGVGGIRKRKVPRRPDKQNNNPIQMLLTATGNSEPDISWISPEDTNSLALPIKISTLK
ncbi:hypothetical protein NDU88_007844 [Pleurodeles waltl]|uniref:Uncharacterized protein n=1 Tax=Pleurodeles waltl TaxID=8319 RepID=A0AAV7QR46_PLEWA|nr:hypothetical protein NDU88_007844 [Pleurodeles waltl]